MVRRILVYSDVVQIYQRKNSAAVATRASLAATEEERDKDWSQVEKYAAIAYVLGIKRCGHEVENVADLVNPDENSVINPVDSSAYRNSGVIEDQVTPAFSSDGRIVVFISYSVKLWRAQTLFSPFLRKFFLV